MEDTHKKILLHMHQFFADEVIHHRSMMWETVKWFTVILLAISGIWIKVFFDNLNPCLNAHSWFVLITLSFFGGFITIICIFLLKTFYKSNLRFVSMMGKTEEDLDFNKRIKENPIFYSDDKYIIHEYYLKQREQYKSSNDEDFIKSMMRKNYFAGMCGSMSWVFYSFGGLFIISFFYILIIHWPW